MKVTQALAGQALAYRYDTLPADVKLLVKQCILDWFGVTLAGSSDPAHHILAAEAAEQGGNGSAGIIGRAGKYPPQQAALVNGTTAHALDFDDVNLAISGHPTAVVFSALLALAQHTGRGGKEVMAAFVAGYETACRVGVLLAPGHLARGYHATGTVCSFGAAAACAHLLGLDAEQTAGAMGIAGTQAAGLKAVFGTMAKPLHAGLAARNGLAAASLVQRGFQGPADILEHRMGFASTHSPDFAVEAALGLDGGFHIRNNLFKYDVACFGTIASLECLRQIKQQCAIAAADISKVTIHADLTVATICNIQRPSTGTEAKFSLRANAAYALLGFDTGQLDTYSDALANDERVVQLREKVEVILVDGWPPMQARVTVRTRDGASFTAITDAGIPEKDLSRQGKRIEEKFFQLAAPLLGRGPASQLAGEVAQFEVLEDLAALARYGS